MKGLARLTPVAVAAAVLGAVATAAAAAVPEPVKQHPEWNEAYTLAIRQATTGPQFMTPLVDHLPAAEGVPTPLEFNGYIAGAPGHLTYAAQVHAYMRSLAAASPRVEVYSIGSTEEGREMIAVAVADEATLADLDRYRSITAELSDPRTIHEAKAAELIAAGKPIYYVTGGLHSPETGSPEMLMELAYRLAVEDTPLARSIRGNVITLITPVLEVDGRERMVDLSRWIAANPEQSPPPLVYWGHYVRHDNNRDAVGRALALTRNVEDLYFAWHPQVMHDLHESIPFLYVSSGTGPYNAWLDPLMVAQWERRAIDEVQQLTAMGLPGVWTHGFYDGWAPGYLFWAAMGHNSLGRFYETFGNMVPSTERRVVRGTSDRAWYRPNPPLPEVEWSLRNNVNYQQSGILLALAWTAEHRREVLEQFWRLGQRSVAKARTEGPAAYVLRADQPRRGQLRDLLELLRGHGIEVSVAEAAFAVKNDWPPAGGDAKKPAATATPAPDVGKKSKRAKSAAKEPGAQPADRLEFPAGSYVVRMDQPYSRLADALLDTQYVRGEERVYDDTGWTLGLARNVDCARVVDTAVLDVPMRAWDGGHTVAAGARPALDGAAAVAVLNHADTDLVRLRYALPEVSMTVTEAATDGKQSLPAGTVLMALDEGNREAVEAALADLDLVVTPLRSAPEVASHEFAAPRLALLHTWTDTQDEGWFRLALEDLGVPYDYVSTQDLAAAGDLRARWDVIMFPPAGGDPDEIVNGLPPGLPLPWRQSELTPNWGRVDATDDIRPGMGIAGVAALTRFVEDGGLLIAVGDAAEFAVAYGLVRWVTVAETPGVKANGSLLAAAVVDSTSPVAWGYDDTVAVYFSREPVFEVGRRMRRRGGDQARPSGRGGPDDPDVPQGRPYVPVPPRPTPGPGEKGFQLPEDRGYLYGAYLPAPEDRPRVILAFPEKAGDILLSGMLDGGAKLAGKAVVVDAPRGGGHVLLIGSNPMWRSGTQGSYALVMNAVANWDHLGIGWPPAPATD